MKPGPVRIRRAVARDNDMVGAHRRGTPIKERRRNQCGARFAQKDFELVHFGEAFEDHGIIAVERQSGASEARRDIDQEDIGQCRKWPVIIEPVCGKLIDKAHDSEIIGACA